jgi:hypothetical protein
MEKCRVEGCKRRAEYEVILYDVYPYYGEVFFQRDFTCPFLCSEHVARNEGRAVGVREPRGYVCYPYTNREGAQGFTIYRPLKRGA